ncbi:MAG: S-layer homology domain-containing protein [Oscillospiraceae bacterium]|nr:S-layer homology domain-containing protein [Oscillospiraceae bacterium]
MKQRILCLCCSVLVLFSCGFSARAYADVPEDIWYADAVRFVTEQGWMEGMGNESFAPEEAVSRAMAVTVLWRMAGAPQAEFPYSAYADLPDDLWYSQAAAWAYPHIMTGYPIVQEDPPVPTGIFLTFEAERSLTREQLAVVLYRYHRLQDPDITLPSGDLLAAFPDGVRVSPWAIEAMSWCLGEDLLRGSAEPDGLLLNPQGEVSRAQLATVLKRYYRSADFLIREQRFVGKAKDECQELITVAMSMDLER